MFSNDAAKILSSSSGSDFFIDLTIFPSAVAKKGLIAIHKRSEIGDSVYICMNLHEFRSLI